MTADLNERERLALALALHRSAISRRDMVEAVLAAVSPETRRELFETFARLDHTVPAPDRETSLPDYEWQMRFHRAGDFDGLTHDGWYWVEVMTVDGEEAYGDSEGPYADYLVAKLNPPTGA